MYQYVKRYWFSICFYILAGVFGTVMGLGSSVVSKYLIDAVTGVRKDKILLFAVLIICMTAAGIISNTAYGGILFSGVSGAGKTTQAELWMKWEQARQINGDRPILYKSDKGWLGCGSPYAGSSECYINECIPIKTIILLEQGTQTSLQRVSITEAVKRIYANSTVYTWNKEYVEKLLNLIMILVQEIPVYRLINRADHDSVEIVKKELQKEVI